MDPVGTLRKPFKAPSGPSRGAVNNDHQGSPFVMNGTQRSVLPTNPIGHAVKKIKSNSGGSLGVVYRDGETTGYEEDGREDQDWVALHRAPTNAQHAVPAAKSQAMLRGMTPLGLKQRGTNETVAESSRAAELPRYYYKCCWRKPQTKKHKSWENDGVLLIIGDKASLYDQENSSLLSSGRLPTDGRYLATDQEFKIGGRDILVQEQLSEDDYLSGKCFGSRSSATAPARTTSTMPTFAPIGFYGASSGPSKKFAAPSVVKPPAYRDSLLGLPPSPASFYGSTSKAAKRKQEDLAADSEGPDTRLQPAMDSYPIKSYTSVGATDHTIRATRNLGPQPVKPSSVWDPKSPGAVVLKRPEGPVEKKLNPNGLPIVDVVLDPGIAHRLREHQIEGIRFMYECVMGMRSEGSGCILADEMGLGKTAQAIALAWTLLKQNPLCGDKKQSVIDLAVVVCPVTLVKNWKKEFNKWVGKDRVRAFTADEKHPVKDFLRARGTWHVLIIGYERLRSIVDDLRKVKIGLLICDEGHRLKSAGAKTTKALRELDVDRRIILSGTPIQNELSEFHAMVDFVIPGLLDSYQTFKKVFEGPIMKARQPGCNANDRELGQHRAEQLHDITSPYILRRTSNIIAGYLPPKSEYVVFVAPTALQKTLYRQIVESSAVRSALDGFGKALTLIDLLKKLCNSPSLLMRQEEQEKANGELVKQLVDSLPPKSRVAGASMSGKMKAVEFMLRTLKEETDEKVVLVSSYVQTLNILQAMCSKHGYGYCRLDGSMKAEERQPSVDKFNKSSQDEQFVFLLSTKAGGTGLNIVGASRLVLFDSDWNPANDLQAMGRIHRDGQKRPCFIYRMLTAGTIDEKIFQRQITKIGLADSLMHGQQAGKSRSGKDGDAFTPQQLRALFTFSEDTPCETHDQLSCGCSSGAGIAAPPEAADGEAEEDVPQITEVADDSDEDLPDVMQGFVQASQYRAPKAKAAQLTSAKDLAVLKEWTHVNCQTDDEDRADNIEDNVLRDMVLRSIGSLRMASSSRRSGYADSDDDVADDLAPPLAALIPQDNGGDITFVFHKKVGALDDKSDESGDKSASTSGTPDEKESRHQSVEL